MARYGRALPTRCVGEKNPHIDISTSWDNINNGIDPIHGLPALQSLIVKKLGSESRSSRDYRCRRINSTSFPSILTRRTTSAPCQWRRGIGNYCKVRLRREPRSFGILSIAAWYVCTCANRDFHLQCHYCIAWVGSCQFKKKIAASRLHGWFASPEPVCL